MSLLQKQILHKAIKQPLFSKDVLPKVPMSVFEDNEVNKEIATVIKRYYQTGKGILTEDTLLTLTEEKLDRLKKTSEEQQMYFNAINEIYEIRNSHDNDIIDEKIESYIKKHMRMELLKKVAVNLDNEQKMEKIDKEFKDIMMLDISGKHQEIINVIDDREAKRRAFNTLYQDVMSTGFRDIDRLNGGGLAKKELGMIVAASGTGKTLMLTNLATNYTKLGKSVLYIALEELENRMLLRFEQSLTRQSKQFILTGRTLNEDRFNKIQDFYKANRDKFGNLFFARYSPQTVTPAKIEQVIADLIIREGIELDVVIIDYPELLRNPEATGDEAKDGGRLFEEMRRIGQDYNVVMWTAAQMNRTAYGASIRTGEHMEGSHRKKNSAELVLAINQYPEEYKEGYIRLYADKVRNVEETQGEKMIGLRVIGKAMTVRDYRSDEEKQVHESIIQSALDQYDSMYKKGKKKDTPAIDYASEINSSITRVRDKDKGGSGQ